ncbi:MAG: sulfatase [Opitutaceae bacterium]|nr:sulfatase [Opitutaceae bacterium]
MRSLLPCLFALLVLPVVALAAQTRPNVLFVISDDQSFAHTSFAGYPGVKTPAFDRVAREGVYFKHGFSPAPGCSPTRAAFLTGRHIWQIEQAGTHASSFPKKYVVYPDALEAAGYFVGLTGKGWGPGNYQIDGRPRNPAGPDFNRRTLTPPTDNISRNDYAGNFADFLAARPKDRPFCFWMGGTEPHRSFAKGSGLKAGKRLADGTPPPFLPDTPEVRSDMLDYCLEIEWFDAHLGRALKQLEEAGELENTLIIVTSDNGMAFPRAKANLYEYGFHLPLAIRWGARVPGGRIVDDLIGFVDLTATIYDATGVSHPSREYPLAGRSILNLLTSGKQGLVEPQRDAVFAGRERHSSARYNNWTYPQRAIRTARHLYIRNFRPDRWPAGDPVVLADRGKKGAKEKNDPKAGKPHSGYKDIDGSPTLDFLVAKADDPKIRPFLDLAVAKRPAEELFDIVNDPGCLKNLAADPAHAATRATLAKRLEDELRRTGDARILDGGEIWETYPRYSPVREFPRPDGSH